MPLIHLNTHIQAPIEVVFDLSRSIELHTLSTAHTNEQTIAGKTSGLLELGETVTWRARHFGVYQTLTSKMTVLERPYFFVDEMVKGIFHNFRHEHIFEAQADTNMMIDKFNYRSPLGILRKLADQLFLKRYMTRLLEKRNQTIKTYAENGRWRELIKY